MSVAKTGRWILAGNVLTKAASKGKLAIINTVRKEAFLHQRAIVFGIRGQRPGGKRFRALSRWTIRKRKGRGFKGTKALIDRGDLIGSVKTVGPIGGDFFVGVLRTARSRDGKNLMNVAQIHEDGLSRNIVLKVDEKGSRGTRATVRQWFMALFLKGLIKAPLKKSTKTITIRGIPARPFIEPIFQKLKRGQEKRMMNTLTQSLLGV